MRRVALILLLALLAFQSLWAAAASACPHERVTGTHGAAHAHEDAHQAAHEHAGTAIVADAASADAHSHADEHAGGVGSSSCHGQANAAVIEDDRMAVTPTRAGIVPSPYARFVADRYPESPLRPPVPRRA